MNVSFYFRYINRFAHNLKAKLRESEKLEKSIEQLHCKRKQAILDEGNCSAQLKIISAKTKELKVHVEKSISLKYNNRMVNIMGCM